MTFAPLQNDSFLRACLGQATPHTPVWLMRQAGRYLPEYCATRAKAGSFMGLATNVDYATEVTLQPLARYPLDAAILFSDILTVPDAMGLGLSFAQGEGPKFEQVVRDEAAVARLAVPDMDKLRYVFDAVASIRKALAGRVPLIGFSGSPWTLACYMVEGGGSQDYRHVKSLLYARPDLMHRVLAVNADSVAAYLNAQIDAGAQAVMIFDSWGGVLADGAFHQFSLAYTARVLGQLKRTGADGQVVPRIVFTKGGGLWLGDMQALACDVLGLDWTMDLGRARRVLEGAPNTIDSIAAGAHSTGARAGFDPQSPRPTALQGNIDPNVLFAPPEAIRAETRRVLDAFGAPHRDAARRGTGHIFNLGHGISQFTPPEHVAHLVDEVHQHSRRLRALV
ncbi:MAG: uroporphyrinogen decarboxylase [Burkholderiales bacterium]|uniref:uroporphyrinogen decarboxylase n=1 Tax=Ottowia sp. TaxID=1898956 RepID=UPI001AC1BB27|nr:uroporphyrinogen decarboxylase [Ottowia sp.]MBN9407116.1 uroporphyrinogen decarboxylase [Burkholderiales bacterium]MBS0414703.1 uroporphyrinogen decarboxylase [Pseudomonadota bacterium]